MKDIPSGGADPPPPAYWGHVGTWVNLRSHLGEVAVTAFLTCSAAVSGSQSCSLTSYSGESGLPSGLKHGGWRPHIRLHTMTSRKEHDGSKSTAHPWCQLRGFG